MNQPQPDAPLDLDAIQARLDAATPGPWHVEDDKQDLNRWVGDRTGYLEINFGYLGNGTQPDARFVAAARTDVEQLLARVRQLEAKVLRLATDRDFWLDITRDARNLIATAETPEQALDEVRELLNP